jgi:hypothetical protein
MNAGNHAHLYQAGDKVDDLTRKIINTRNRADGANYFANPQKISEAKAMAQEIIKGHEVAKK